MANNKIPDDFYVDGFHLAHKSCTRTSNGQWSNDRNTMRCGRCNQTDVDVLRYICNMYDILNKKTYFEENKYKNLCTFISKNSFVLVNNGEDNNINFIDIESLLEYLAEHYPECIRSDDIKIALKD
jgi:hypothetical protein